MGCGASKVSPNKGKKIFGSYKQNDGTGVLNSLVVGHM